jgi:hypothetical protein
VETHIPSYRCHRYPAEIIAQYVRLYYRFPLSHRGIEELMFERGIIVSYLGLILGLVMGRWSESMAVALACHAPGSASRWASCL